MQLNQQSEVGSTLSSNPSKFFMVVLVTLKNEEDQISSEGTRVATTLSISFYDAQGELTP